MSHTLRRPLLAARYSPLSSKRCFSHARPVAAKHRGNQSEVRGAQRIPDRSVRIVQKEAGIVPNDLGLLEQTYIPPRGKNFPSLTEPYDILRLTWKHVLLKLRDIFSLLVVKAASPRDPAPKASVFRRVIKLQNSKILPAAQALHTQMYTAFAENDSLTLRKICCDGIYDSMRARIEARSKDERVVWELVRYNGRQRLVSNRAARLHIDGQVRRQAVVRIGSRQKLTRWRKGENGKEEVVPGSGKAKDVVEYLVVQRSYEGWKDDEGWRVWGTTKETPLWELDEWRRIARGVQGE